MYAEEEVAPAGSACGIVLLLYARAGFPGLVWLSHPSCCESDFLLLKLLEFIRDVPVFLTLACWQRLLTHFSECLWTVSLIQATTSLPILWSIEWTLQYNPSHLKESITSRFLIIKSWILIELQNSGLLQRTKLLLHSKLGDRIYNISFLSTLILPRF